MGRFFSCVSDGQGKLYYMTSEQRAVVYAGGVLPCEIGQDIEFRDDLDSHSQIASYYGLDVDGVNKFEFRPLDRKFKVDQINNKKDDTEAVKRQVLKMDMQLLCPPEVTLHDLLHPFNDIDRQRITNSDLLLFKKWVSVRASVRDFVGISVWASMRDSVWASVRDSVGDSVRDSVENSVPDSVRIADDSVRDSVQAYYSSFFTLRKWKHEKYANPNQSCIDLWNRGIVSSFDGKNWRLHGGGGKVLKTLMV